MNRQRLRKKFTIKILCFLLKSFSYLFMIHFSGPLGLVSIDYTLKNLIYSETDSKTSKTFRTAADLLISCEFLFFFVLNVFVALPMELQTHVSEN